MTETEKPDDLAGAFGLAVYRPNPPGEILTVELERGGEGQPSLLVRFRRPSPVDVAEIEARARRAAADLLSGQIARARYGVDGDALKDEAVIASLTPLVSAIESASMLWTDWNLGDETPEGPVKASLDVARIAELLRGRPNARAAWAIHLDNAGPLDRAEGNGSAASPVTSTDGAANTAGDAPSEHPPAAAASEAEAESSAQGPNTDP